MTDIIGTNGNDTLVGSNDPDTIKGLAGNDTIIGNKYDDTLTGGDGQDKFVYNFGDDNDIIMALVIAMTTSQVAVARINLFTT
ncbi:hypothetical protein [Nostoc sp. PCC 9305]|uniref:hypothetical protein n=1 Tax=Nostoc sp. PCC 9305 TaxID=296636 RepID=UPI0039C6F37C